MNTRQLSVRSLAGLSPDSEEARVWRDLVGNDQTSGFMQSLEWAHFKSQQGLECLFLGIFDQDSLVGGSFFYFSKSAGGATLLVAPDGPVLPWHDGQLALECLNLLINHCENLTRTQLPGLIGLRIEPRLPLPVPDLLIEFARAPLDLLPQESVYLDLAAPLDQIMARMKPKGRYNTRLSERKGVKVRAGSSGEMIDTFYPLICECGRRDNFAVEPLSFFVEMASTLMPTGLVTLLLAEHEDEVLGGLVLVTCGKMATYLYGATSNNKRNCMVGYALQWAAIQLARQAGCIQYDLYGYDQFCNSANRYGRFSKFKSQFGGEVRRFIGAHDYYFIDELTDTVIRALKEVGS